MPLPVAGDGLWQEGEARAFRRLTLAWMGTMMFLFSTMLLLGYFMRLFQANAFRTMRPEWFYAVLTLHGLGMVATWFVGGMAATGYLLTRYSRPSIWISRLALAGTLVGAGLLAAATLFGLFGTGWYFLYPLPFYSSGVWPPWATGCFFGALALLFSVWTIWVLDLLRAIASRFPLRQALGWHVLSGRPSLGVPSFVLVATVSRIAGAAGLAAGMVLLGLWAVEWLRSGYSNDALLMKNLTFFFGHIITNITMYLGVGVVYELLPGYAGRPWKLSKALAWAWNTVLLLVVLAYAHHLYMDFAQPRVLQDTGQIVSYFLSVPAAVVSIFGGLALVYAAPMRWTLASWLFFLGLMGWAIGGVGAVIDSTVALNSRFHNTLWVPAHFHTYYLMGVVLMLLGFAHHLAVDLTGEPERPAMRHAILALLAIGGYGFLLAFYWAGAHSVPRRFAAYPRELSQGVAAARVAVVFIALIVIAVALYLWETARRCWRAFSA